MLPCLHGSPSAEPRKQWETREKRVQFNKHLWKISPSCFPYPQWWPVIVSVSSSTLTKIPVWTLARTWTAKTEINRCLGWCRFAPREKDNYPFLTRPLTPTHTPILPSVIPSGQILSWNNYSGFSELTVSFCKSPRTYCCIRSVPSLE